MTKQKIISIIQQLTKHNYVEITPRGNSAIHAVVSILPKGKNILIPGEGGWLTYKTIPRKLGLETVEVDCNDAKIDLKDLQDKLATKKYSSLIFQNPGGYYAEQNLEKIYQICKENDCLVVLDVSGSIGTDLCDGEFADIIVGSFGRWKLVEAGSGGFVSCNSKELWDKMKEHIELLDDETKQLLILEGLQDGPNRIGFLMGKVEKVRNDLGAYDIIRPNDKSFVVVVKHKDKHERERILEYCEKNDLEWTICPRYIRFNDSAISIEVKRLRSN